MSQHHFTRSTFFRATALVAVVASLHAPLAAAPEDTIREGSPGVSASASALAAPSSRATGQVHERSGSFTYAYPIAVPPGRLGMEPSLALTYSSDSPMTGGVAAGWQLSLPEITRDPSRGLDGTDYEWTSSFGRLVRYTEPGTTGTNTFRAWGDSSFTRFTRVDVSRWEARTTEGLIHKFERVSGSTDDRLVLVSSTDRFGNTVEYIWMRAWTPAGYAHDQLQSIIYTGNKNQGVVHHARVTFLYGASVSCGDVPAPIGSRLIATSSGTFVLRDASPLTTIRTEVRDAPTGAFRTVREVALSYQDLGCGSGGAPLTPLRLLSSIQESARAPDGTWKTMPAVGLQYGDSNATPTVARTGENFLAGNWPLQPNALSWGLSPTPSGQGDWDWSELHSTLIDLDGDGDQDRLVASRYDDNGWLRLNRHCTALLYRNLGGNQFSETAYPVVLPRQWQGEFCTLSSQPKIPPFNSAVGVPTVGNGWEVPVSVSRFLDIDRDGLVDVVSAVFLRQGDSGTNDQSLHHPNCDPGVQNPSWVVCGGPGDSVLPPVVPVVGPGGFLTVRRSQFYNGRYVWRWYRNTGHSDFELTPRFIASPIPLELVGAARFPNDVQNKEVFALVDLTGDGALDAVWTNPNIAGWSIWKGNGQGAFTGNPDGSPLAWTAPETAGAIRSTWHEGYNIPQGGASLDFVTSSLIDVNNDGLLDLVTDHPLSWQTKVIAYLNTGRGFTTWSSVVFNDDRRATERLLGAYVNSPQDGSPIYFSRVQQRRLADVNGDGLLDRLEYNGETLTGNGTLSVAYGYCPDLTQSSSVSGPVTAELGVGVSSVFATIGNGVAWFGFGEMTDMDGDGYVDVIGSGSLSGTPVGPASVQVFGLPASAATSPPALLTRIDSGRDASTLISYASRTDASVVSCSTPVSAFAPCDGVGKSPRRVVRDVTLWSEGRSGPAVTSYQYEDPIAAPDELGRISFRGFARVRVTSPSHGYANGTERRAVSISDFSYAPDYRGQLVTQRVLDEQGRIQRLEQRTYARLHVATSGKLPTFASRMSRQWMCVPRQGTLTVQEDACRQDVGLETNHYWTAFAPYDISGYPWIEGEPGPNVTLWRETTMTQVAIGDGGGGPTRRTDSAFGLITDGTRYLSYPTTTTTSEVNGTTATKLAEQIIEYDQMPLALPFKTKTWLRESDYATAMRRFHSATGVVLWEQKPEQYRRAPNASDTSRVKTSFAYDPFFLYPITTTNELGHVVGVTKDLGTGVVVATEGPNAWTNPSCAGTCPPVRERTRTDVDGFGRVTATWASQDHPTLGYELKQSSATTYTDQAGTWPRVETRRFQVLGDATTAIRELVQLDATGLVLSATQFASASGSDPLDATTSFVYDSAGATINVTAPDPSADTQYVTYQAEFDALGREVKVTSPEGASVTTMYSGATTTRQETAPAGDPNPGQLATKVATVDAFGDLRTITEVDDSLLALTSYEYDGLGRIRGITDPGGVVTTLAHDGGGRRTSISRVGGVWLYGYDDNGNATTEVVPHLASQDPLRYTTSTVYDDLDRPISRAPGARDLTTQETSSFGDGTASWMYDSGMNGIGRLYLTSSNVGASSWMARVFSYDALGSVRWDYITFSIWGGLFTDSRWSTRDSDALGKPRLVTHADAAGSSPATQVAHEYDLRGLPTTVRWLTAPGAPVAISTQVWNRAQMLTHRSNGVSEQSWQHYRDGRTQNVSVQARPNATSPWTTVASQTLTYFSAGDVKDMTTTTAVPSQQASFIEDWTFDYDDRHQLTAVSGPSYEGLFTYTSAGRLQSVYVDGPPELDRDAEYEYTPAALGDPETVRTIQGPNLSLSYQWDLAGNQTSKERLGHSLWTFRYDGNDQLREARGTVASAAQREVYWYGADGQRLFALTFGTGGQPSSLKLWFGEDEIHYAANGAVSETQAYVSHGTSVGRIVNRASIEYTFSNHLGHLLAAVDAGGNATAGFTYSPYGELIRTLGADAADLRRRFNGKEHDASTGLHYYGARYYDDFAFLWTQADPLYLPIPDLDLLRPRTALLYAFSGNNPLRYVDPDGRGWFQDLRNFAADAIEIAGPVVGAYFGCALTLETGCIGGAIGGAAIGGSASHAAASLVRDGGDSFSVTGNIAAAANGATYEMGGRLTAAVMGAAWRRYLASLDAAAPAPALPAHVPGSTEGVLVTNEGEVYKLASGGADPRYGNYIPAGHVEGKAAIIIRETASSGGTVWHNNPDGTCPFCRGLIATLLPEGAHLKVVPPANAVAKSPRWSDLIQTFVGNAREPKPNLRQ